MSTVVVRIGADEATADYEPPSGVVFGANAEDGNATAAARVAAFGRLPQMRCFYGPNALPATFNPNKEGRAPEGRFQVSFKWAPSEVLAGQWDARLDSYFGSVAAKLADGTLRQVKATWWHEPNGEIKAGTFTPAQYTSAWYRIAGRLAALGMGDKLVCAPTFSGPQASSAGIYWTDAMVPARDRMPANSVWCGDNYGNPSGGLGYDSPYPSVASVLDPTLAMLDRLGWADAWAITEVNTPRRNHDPDETKRVQWFTDYVAHCQAQAHQPRHITLWEGAGAQFDQWFKTDRTKGLWRSLTAASA